MVSSMILHPAFGAQGEQTIWIDLLFPTRSVVSRFKKLKRVFQVS
jgi:hypothetical protein